MLNTGYIRKLRQNMLSYALKRREIIKQSGDALHQSKRAIFALQRDNVSEAAEKLTLAKKIFTDLEKTFHKEAALLDEGSYLAALEEYVEAALLHQFLTTGKIGEVKGMAVAVNVYIAGLCDLPGELYRYAIKAATKHEIEMVKKCARLSDDIIGELIEFDLTSYLRTKFDQAKQANHRLEQVVYETSLREINPKSEQRNSNS